MDELKHRITIPKADYDELMSLKEAFFNQELVVVESEYYHGYWRGRRFYAVAASEASKTIMADSENVIAHNAWVDRANEFQASLDSERSKPPKKWWRFW